MFCCSRKQLYKEPLLGCYERCIFCLGTFNDEFVFLTYYSNVFTLNEKHHRINCICRPFCHIPCMKSWILESMHCPECSVPYTNVVEKNHCTFFRIFCFVFTCFSLTTLALIIIRYY